MCVLLTPCCLSLCFLFFRPASVLYLFDVMETMTSVSDRILNTDCAMEEPNRAIPLTYEKAILYMIGPLCFVGSATVFWAFVHCVLTCLFSDKYNRDKREKNREKKLQNETFSTARTPKRATRKQGSMRGRSSLLSLVRSKVDKYDEEWTFKDTKRYLIVSVLVTMVILHPTLTRQCLFMFMCVNIENGTYLRKDVQLECYTDEHITYLLTVGIPGILACKVYSKLCMMHTLRVGFANMTCFLFYSTSLLDVIGIPAITFWVLYRRRFKLNLEGPAGNETRKTYGFIYQGYGIFYWEVVVSVLHDRRRVRCGGVVVCRCVPKI